MKHGDRVCLKNVDSVSFPRGTIVGTATVQRIQGRGSIQFLYMVELDNGFYNQDQTVWTSILAVDFDSMIPIE